MSEKKFEWFQVDNVSPGAAQRNTDFADLLLTVDQAQADEVLLVFDPLWQYCLS